MKVITLNLHLLQETNQQMKLEKIAQYINDNDIDICFFQEVAQHFESPLVLDNIRQGNNAYIIYSLLKDKYHIYYEFKKRGWAVFEEGLAIVSKHPFIDKKWFFISKTKELMDWTTRIILKTTIKIENELLDCYCIHMGWNQMQEKFYDQVNELFKEVNKSKNRVILAGDFNANHACEEIQVFYKKGFMPTVDFTRLKTINHPTFYKELDADSLAKNRHIDYIFVNFPVKLSEYRIDFKLKRNYVSDHFLVYSEISFK